jgi:hypothetical protein
MMGPAFDVPDSVLLEFGLESRGPTPVRVLPPVVGEHLLRYPVLGDPAAIGLEHMLGGLGTKQSQARDVAGVVVDVSDQVSGLSTQTEREDVGLPHLVRRGPLKEPRLRRVLLGLLPGRRNEVLFMKGLAHRLRTGLQEEHPSQQLRDPLAPVFRVLHLDLDGLLPRR